VESGVCLIAEVKISERGSRPENGRAPLYVDMAAFAGLTGWAYFPVAFIGRLPFAMMIVGVLTVVAINRDSVAEAGLAAGLAGIGTAICGPFTGFLADRFSQRSVLLSCSAVSVVAVAWLLFLLAASAPFTFILMAAFVVGGMTPQVAPFSRSRLVVFASRARTEEKRQRATSMVMSYESVMDEASFMMGPVLVGILTSLIAPWAPLVLAAMITATIVVAFALHPSATLSLRTDILPTRNLRGIFSPRVTSLALGMFLVGGVFGSILTALTEFMRSRGLGEETGVAYGAMSAGAIIVAIVLALTPWSLGLSSRWVSFGALGVVGAITLLISPNLPIMLGALFLSGCGIGAVLVALFSLGAQVSPPGRSTTVLTTLQSSLVIGQALTTAVSGLVITVWGPGAGFTITVAVAIMLTILGVVFRRFLRVVRSP
jgi:MFS family permease